MCPPSHASRVPLSKCLRVPADLALPALVLTLLVAITGSPAPSRAEPCAAWPGEVSPLPTTSDPDRMLAQWATLRRDELSRVAGGLEGIDRLEAHRLWRHAHCLDPGDPRVESALERTRPASLHRPHVRAPGDGAGSEPVAASTFETALQQLTVRVIAAAPPAAEPVRQVARTAAASPREEDFRPAATQPKPVETAASPQAGAAAPVPKVAAAGPPPKPEARCGTTRTECSEIEALSTELARLDALLRGARFRETLERADEMSGRLRSLDRSAPSRELRVRAEVLRATAEVALGNASQARDAFARALLEDPELHLDPMAVSPKVRRALEEARRGGLGG